MRRTKFASVLIALILGSFIGAKAQYSYEKHFMAVGEEKQVDLPISVTNKNIIESYWSNGSPSYVEMTQLSDYSVKIKILKYISTTCYVQFDYYCGPSREHGNYTVFIDIKKPQKLDISASPSGGTINSGDRVYLSVSSSGSSVSGASIYYSLDGGSPKTSYSSSCNITRIRT